MYAEPGYWIICLIIAAGLGFIPASIAKKKGHSFGLWWLYGWLLFIVAIIHVNFIKDLSGNQPSAQTVPAAPAAKPASPVHGVADELKKYKALLDDEVITQEEFDAKKKQLLNL